MMYDPMCYLCRKEAGKGMAGITENDLCFDHLRQEYIRLKTDGDYAVLVEVRAVLEELFKLGGKRSIKTTENTFAAPCCGSCRTYRGAYPDHTEQCFLSAGRKACEQYKPRNPITVRVVEED